MDLVIFDLETTGFSPMANDIIQIAAVRLRDGIILEEDGFSTFVDPCCRIPSFIESHTGISDGHVCKAPKVREALGLFSQFVGNSTVLAHNGHRFDMPFIRAACAKSGAPTRTIHYADSMDLSKRVWRNSRSHSLDMVIELLEMDTEGYRRHDARGDVSILAVAVMKMWARLTNDTSALPAPIFTGAFPV
jgi:DNA polymerase III alpha subunit (gram-positive type)